VLTSDDTLDDDADHPGLLSLRGDGTDLRQIPAGALGQHLYDGPWWSPGGDRIAVSLADPVNPIDLDMVSVVALDPESGAGDVLVRKALSVAWSPDGTTMAFVRIPGQIYLVHDSDARRIPGHGGWLTWLRRPPPATADPCPDRGAWVRCRGRCGRGAPP
jgi:hypothetical protein